MKKTLRNNNGITLVALVITIIILLILATVSIKLVTDSGIIKHAENATKKYSEAEESEKVQLAATTAMMNGNGEVKKESLTNALKEYFGEQGDNTWKYVEESEKYFKIKIKISGRKYTIYKNGSTLICKTLEDYGLTEDDIGKTVSNYEEIPEGEDASNPAKFTPNPAKGSGSENSGKDEITGKYKLTATKPYERDNLGWKILGVNEKGELELISDNPTSRALYFANEEGYLYGPDELNRMCSELYGHGKYASGARSLNVEDVNKLTGYVPSKGKEYKYRFPTEEQKIGDIRVMQYSINGGSTWYNMRSFSDSSNLSSFRIAGETEILDINNAGKEKTVINEYYQYNILDELINKSEIANMIIKGTGDIGINQWLASRWVSAYSDIVYFLLYSVQNNNYIGSSSGYYSNGMSNCSSRHIRPVVSLKSNVQLEKDGDGYKIVENNTK